MKIEAARPETFIPKLAKHLEKHAVITPPAEADFVKTGHGKERAPQAQNWYFVRVASILRRLYMHRLKTCPADRRRGTGLSLPGVAGLARKYGGAKNNGHVPEHTVTGSKSLVRKAIQRLEKAGYVALGETGGRFLTNKALGLMEQIAAECD